MISVHQVFFGARRGLYRLKGADQPIYVFHHVPKAAGTSVVRALSQIFFIVRDYRKPWASFYPKPRVLSSLVRNDCLCGHFELEGYRLPERYPELFDQDKYRVFTFLRDPLASAISLHRYLCSHGQTTEPLEAFLLRVDNRISRILMVSRDNYKKRLDSYFFIGIVEYSQKSFSALCLEIGEDPVSVPSLNQTIKRNEIVPTNASPEVVSDFKQRNELDYLVYAEAKRRLSLSIKNSYKQNLS